MFERFVKESRAAVVQARDEAKRLGSPVIEAEHLLLALALNPSGAAGDALAESGLDHRAVSEALETEFKHSLGVVGVSAEDLDLEATPPADSTPGWSASAKRVFERALQAAVARGDRRLEPAHLLLGVLAAEAGTVPRALGFAGVLPGDLAARTHAALSRRSK